MGTFLDNAIEAGYWNKIIFSTALKLLEFFAIILFNFLSPTNPTDRAHQLHFFNIKTSSNSLISDHFSLCDSKQSHKHCVLGRMDNINVPCLISGGGYSFVTQNRKA